MFATGKTVGLAKWIIDDTCLVYFVKYRKSILILNFVFQFGRYSRHFGDEHSQFSLGILCLDHMIIFFVYCLNYSRQIH